MRYFIGTLFIAICIHSMQAQDHIKVRAIDRTEGLFVDFKSSDSTKVPEVYVDGIKYNMHMLSLMDPNKIESVTVFKGATAKKRFNAPNGVILVRSKEFKVEMPDTTEQANEDEIVGPLVIVDGDTASYDELNSLDPGEIISISILKDQEAIALFNAPQGVIVVETEKGQ